MTLGQRIGCILKERSLKQVDFANTLGITSNYVNLLVNDKKCTISDTLAKLIEETYGYSSKWVKDGTGEKLVAKALTYLKLETIKKIKKLSDDEVTAVLAFINSLDSIKKKGY